MTEIQQLWADLLKDALNDDWTNFDEVKSLGRSFWQNLAAQIVRKNVAEAKKEYDGQGSNEADWLLEGAWRLRSQL